MPIETRVKGGVIVGFFETPVKEPKPVEAEAPTKAEEKPAKATKAPTKKATSKKK